MTAPDLRLARALRRLGASYPDRLRGEREVRAVLRDLDRRCSPEVVRDCWAEAEALVAFWRRARRPR